MRKFLQKAVLVALLAVSWTANAHTLTLANGTQTNSTVPVYGTFCNVPTLHHQMLYTADFISSAVTTIDMTYGNITSMVFYSSNTNVSWDNTYEIRLMEVSATTMGNSSFIDTTGATLVFTGRLGVENGMMTISFERSYTYNGGNLLVDFTSIEPGEWFSGSSAFFYGVNTSTLASRYFYMSSSGSVSGQSYAFLPKVTFTFNGGTAVPCPSVSSHSVGTIDSNSVVINWVDNINTGASHTVTYWPEGASSDDTLTTTVATGSSATLTGLAANTVYHYTVHVVCSDSAQSVTLGGSFRTACATIPVPFSEDFDSYQTGTFLPCWHRFLTSGNAPRITTMFRHSGAQSLCLEAENDTLLVVPPSKVPLAGNNIYISYQAYLSSNDNDMDTWIKVGVMTDTTDISTFIPLDSIGYHNFNGHFEHYTANTSQLNPTARYWVAWMFYGRDSLGVFYRGAIDDIYIDDLSMVSDCQMVRNLTADTVTADSVYLHWTPGNEEIEWAVRVNGGAWMELYQSSYVFADLLPSTAYTFDVVAICNGNSEMRSITVRTRCADYLNAPYEADFVSINSASRLPWCWNRLEANVVDTNVFPYISSHTLAFHAGAGGVSSVVLPRIDNLAPNAINVEVNGYVGSANAKLYFGYVTHPDMASTFVALDSITVVSARNYEFNTSTVENVDTLWLAFRCTTTGGNVDAYINSLRINRYSNCARPCTVVLDTLTYNSVGLSWPSTGALTYQIAVSTATDVTSISEDDIYDSDAGVDTVKVIGNLEPGTHYNTWVRALCNNETSEWRQGPSFTTYCGSDYCVMSVSAEDGYYGYGVYYGNCGIEVYIDDIFYGKVGMEGTRHYPYPSTLDIPVCPTQHVVCIAHASSSDNWFGGYNGYVTLTVLDGGGEVIYTGNCSDVVDGSVIADLTEPCPSCMPVTAVAVDADATTASSVTIHWTPGNVADETWAVMLNDSVVSTTVNDTTYTFTGLTSNTLYTFGVATVCDPGNISYYTTVASGTECGGVECDIYVTLDGIDYNGVSYINSWYLADIAADVYQNGIRKATLSVPHGTTVGLTYLVSVCGGDSVQLVYREGSLTHTYSLYLPLAEYVVINGNGDTLGSGVGMDTYADGDVFVQGVATCPSCIAPTNIQVVDVATTSVTLGWTDVTPATAWIVQVDNGSTTASHVVTTNPCTITGLQPASVYTFSMAAICDTVAGDTSNYSSTFSVTTECNPLTLPWDYNVYTDMIGMNGRIPRCWYAVESWSNNTNTYPYGLRMDYNTIGYIYLYVNESYANGNRVMAASPRIPEAGNNLYVKFHAQGSDVSLAQAGVITDVNDPTTFIPILNVPGTEGDYDFFTEGVTGLTASDTVHIAFRNQLVPNGSSVGNFYVHRLHVQKAPNCQRPDSVVVSNITSSGATLTWPNTGATRYEVTLNGTVYSVTTNSLVLTGLSAGTNYAFSLVGICSDTSIALNGGFTTECTTAITLPYAEGFENYANYSAPHCWTRKNLTADNDGYMTPYVINNHAHSGSGSLEFYDLATHPMAITPALTGTVINNLYVSFWVAGGASMGFAAGFMTDPDVDSTFIPMINVASTSSNYTRYSFYTDSIADASTVYHFAIRFNNNNITPGSIYVDDIFVRAVPDCAQEFDDVHVGDVTGDSVTIHFTPGMGRNIGGAIYTVNVMDTTGAVVATDTTTTSPVVVGGLTERTPYMATVSIICGGNVSATSTPVYFTTRCVYHTLLVVENDVSVNSNYLPINGLYKHSASQQIYYASELGNASDITSVSFNYNPVSSTPLRGISSKIYMAHTTELTMSGGWMDPATMELVYEGYLDCQVGWNEFRFDTAFAYNGVDNVVLMVIADSTGILSGARFRSHEVMDNISVRFTSDNYPFIYGAMTTSTLYTRYRNDVIFYSCIEGPCEQPIFIDSVINETAVTISYSGGGESYELAIVPGTLADFEAAINTMTPDTDVDTVHTFSGLTGETMYTVAVRTRCSATSVSDWVTMTVTTLRHPCAVPGTPQVTGNTYDGATVTWTAGENETEWELKVFCNSPVYEHTYTVSDTPSQVVSGLDAATTYSVTVRAVCDSAWYSVWSDTVDLTTITCPIVTGVTASNVTATGATISWNSTNAVKYEVEYGEMGFQTGTGTTVFTTNTTITLNNLEEQSTYDVFVRGYCTENVAADWSERYRFNTPAAGNGIADVENSNVTLYPNPASSMVTIGGLEGESTVTVVDLNGREVYRDHTGANGHSGQATATGSVTIDVSGYAKGAYFVRVTGESTTAIRKLIVK